VADASQGFVHSSHCLEHLADPAEGLRHWFRAVKPGGHLIVTVPDEDLYEQRQFPSTHNPDHKWSFTIWKQRSWSARSLNVLDLLRGLGPAADLRKLALIDAAYRYALPRFDQTLTPVAECAIEFVVRKRAEEEIAEGGPTPNPGALSADGIYVLTGLRVKEG
jgi:SAM-dependent methyltransferase